MAERVNPVTAVLAVMYSCVKGWLGGFYGSATPTFAFGFVFLALLIQCLFVAIAIDAELIGSLVTKWRSEFLVGLIVVVTAIDLAFIETGKADRWASQARDQYRLLREFGTRITVGFLAISILSVPIWLFVVSR